MPTKKPTTPATPVDPTTDERITLELPESLEGLSDAELTAAEQLRRDTFLGLREGTVELEDGETLVAVGTQIAAQVESIVAERNRRNEARQAETVALDEIANRIAPPVVEEAPVAPAEVVNEVIVPEVVEAPVEVRELEPVAASITPVVRPISVRPKAFSTDLAPASTETVDVITKPKGGIVLTAATDANLGRIGGNKSVQMGHKINLDTFALMAAEAHRTAGVGNVEGNLYLAKMDLPFDEAYTLGDDPIANGEKFQKLIEAVNEPSTLMSGLTAAAVCGHCIPAPRILEFCDISSVDGLLQLPTMRAERGGLQWVVSPTLADWMTKTTGMYWTTAMDCDTTTNPLPTKSVITVDCPGMQAVCEVEGHYLSLRFKNMGTRSWPELYKFNMGLAIKAHQYQQNLRNITRVLSLVTGSTITLPTQVDGIFSNLCRALELAVTDYRDRFATDLNFVFEVVMPTWVRAMVRSDLSRRNGVELNTITNEEIVREFNIRGVRPQFIRGWQSMGSSTPATSYPLTLDFLLFPAGALVQIDQGTLDLGMEIRDNASNARNEFGGFVEDFSNICHPCFDIRRYSMAVCDNGTTGAQVSITCS